MASITVTIGDSTKGPFNLAALFATPAPAGVTVAPTTPTKPSSRPSFVSVQADPGNTTKNVYVGDSQLLGGTNQGRVLTEGQTRQIEGMTPLWALNGYFVNGDNGAVINIEVLGGT